MRLAPLLFCALLFGVSPGSAQIPAQFEAGSAVQSREDLTRLLGQLEDALASPVYTDRVKNAIRADAQRIRERLEYGDFQVGDRVALDIQGELNPTDTLPVLSGPMISLPDFGEISLAGVLRSEVEAHLRVEIGKYIKDPVVRANALMRVSIQGGVGNPGYFVVPTDMLLSEALMYAGGPAQGSEVEKMTVERGGREILGGPSLQDALAQGRTLDQLNLQAGDQIVVPVQVTTTGRSMLSSVARFGFIIATSVLFGIRVF